MIENVLRMVDIDKSFGGVHALSEVNLDVNQGEVHILMGENGAGKSTLVKILNGVILADRGMIYVNGSQVNINSTVKAKDIGIMMIHQELSMCKNMMVSENVFRGEEPTKKPFGFVDHKKMHDDAQAILDHMDIKLNSRQVVSKLSIAEQQMVEIASAVSRNARIVIMDEPTSSLTEKEIMALFKIIAELKSNGVGIIYISHRLNETFEIGDRVTVLRDGHVIGTRDVKDTNPDELIEMMVGRPLTEIFKGQNPVGQEVVLEVKNIRNWKLKDVSFELRKGEILGFSGLIGSGRTELMNVIFGLDPADEGELFVFGEKKQFKNSRQAMEAGIGMVPEDRRGAGLILMHSIGRNLTLTVLHKFIKGIIVNHRIENEIIDKYKKVLSIKMTSPSQPCHSLSGGNQQKIVISKWLASEPKILILDEPTRGIDVGVKAEIYQLMRDLANQGISIIFVSSDLPEIINLSSRIVVMGEGRIKAVLDASTERFTQQRIMHYATGDMSHAK